MEMLDKKAYTIMEISEALGVFPSDIEPLLKKLSEEGILNAFWYEHELYLSLADGGDIEKVKSTIEHLPGYQ